MFDGEFARSGVARHLERRVGGIVSRQLRRQNPAATRGDDQSDEQHRDRGAVAHGSLLVAEESVDDLVGIEPVEVVVALPGAEKEDRLAGDVGDRDRRAAL